ncbi:MAG: hypothetical protein MZV65_54405 [Chromatiales bacterium]|nr:hypothetical protein [Chromatiales bacterium]
MRAQSNRLSPTGGIATQAGRCWSRGRRRVYHRIMIIDQRGSIGHAGWLVAAIATAAAAGGCDARPSAPEEPRRVFCQKAGAGAAGARRSARGRAAAGIRPRRTTCSPTCRPKPPSPTCARAPSSTPSLGFHVAGTARPAVDERRVEVVVVGRHRGRHPPDGALRSVDLRKVGDDWRVVRLRADLNLHPCPGRIRESSSPVPRHLPAARARAGPADARTRAHGRQRARRCRHRLLQPAGCGPAVPASCCL